MAESLLRATGTIHEARRLMLAGRPEDGLKDLDSMVIDSASLLVVRGECLYSLSRFKEARECFARALLLSPNSPRAEIMLELSADMAELDRTIRPKVSIESLVGRGEATESITFPSLGADTGAEPLVPEPALADEIGLVSETLADLMIRQGKYDDARKVFIQLSRLNPDRYEYFRERLDELDQRS